jgi:predicted Zn-dependent protease
MDGPIGAAARLALIAIAVLVGSYALNSERAEHRCDEASAAVLREAQGVVDAAEAEDAIALLAAGGCRDTRPTLVAAGTLAATGREAAGAALARDVVRREPDNALAWQVLASTLADADPAGARRARARLAELNPLAGATR